tara:strand:- start:7606 stop:8043 length:438 start_codon:yes stop_codon:yes gene_type:complete
MKLSMFDFDNTLVKTPYEDSPYLDTKESLDSEKWEFSFNKETVKNYFNELNEKEVVTVLLTNRIDSVKEQVMSILKTKDINFNEELFILGKDGDRSKGKRVESLIKKYPETTEIEYWEDKDKHIDDVVNYCKKYPNIKLKVNKVI